MGGKGEKGSQRAPPKAAQGESHLPFSPSLRGMEIWKTLQVYHIPTPLRPPPFSPPTFSRKKEYFLLFLDTISKGPYPLGGHILSMSFSLFFVLIIACPEELFKSTGQAIFTNNILLTACINYDRRGIMTIA